VKLCALVLVASGCKGLLDIGDPTLAVPPRIITGGGIGDGPIEGVAYVYVIDDVMHAPISGATVRVGDVEGTTDAVCLSRRG
jgi:hypothetical protein